MSPDEARDRFSDAFEDALSRDERAAFDRALAEDAVLADEYRTFCDVLAETRALGRIPAPRPSVDLLEGAKARIRKRTRGRFARDRFAGERAPLRLLPLIVAVLLLLLVGIGYAGMHYMEALRSANEPREETPTGTSER